MLVQSLFFGKGWQCACNLNRFALPDSVPSTRNFRHELFVFSRRVYTEIPEVRHALKSSQNPIGKARLSFLTIFQALLLLNFGGCTYNQWMPFSLAGAKRKGEIWGLKGSHFFFKFIIRRELYEAIPAGFLFI